MQQRSDEWFKARLGKVTASRVYDVVSKISNDRYSKARENYMMELLCERLTGNPTRTITTQDMQRGTDLEPLARSIYESVKGVLVVETGFINHPTIEGFGASPDGLVNPNGLVEIKCPKTAQHIHFIKTRKIPIKYQFQMLAQLSCTGRDWNDYTSFDDRLPPHLEISTKRLRRNKKHILTMEKEIIKFLDELNKLEQELKNGRSKQGNYRW